MEYIHHAERRGYGSWDVSHEEENSKSLFLLTRVDRKQQ